jgi:hypothetical protein
MLAPVEVSDGDECAGEIDERGDNRISDPALERPGFGPYRGGVEANDSVAQAALQPARDPEMEIRFDLQLDITRVLCDYEALLRTLRGARQVADGATLFGQIERDASPSSLVPQLAHRVVGGPQMGQARIHRPQRIETAVREHVKID